jgi:PleD family two-component response regulator
VSIGMALITPDVDGADRILQLADSAMYRAKVSGRNAICWQL